MALLTTLTAILALHALAGLSPTSAAPHSEIFGHEDWTFPNSAAGHSCRHVPFRPAFESLEPNEKIHVQVNVGFQRESDNVVFSSWAQNVTTSGFDACSARSGLSGPHALSIEWLAYVSIKRPYLAELSGTFQDAIIQFDDFTTEKKCNNSSSSKIFPTALVTAVSNNPQPAGTDGAFLWMENSTESTVSVCFKEAQIFSGVRSGLAADVLTFHPQENPLNASESGYMLFQNERNLLLCKTIEFSNHYYEGSRPAVLLSPKITDQLEEGKEVVVAAWSQSANNSGVNICVRSSSAASVFVSWVAFGVVDPCQGVVCTYYGVCEATGPSSFHCVAPTCDDTENPVCTSEGVFYKNECEFQKFIFNTRENVSIHHKGSCYGFHFQSGLASLRSEIASTELACQTATFQANLFYPGKPIHALASVDFHTSSRDPDFVHDATVVWVESLKENKIKICTLSAGRGERHNASEVSASWMVYQGAPDDTMGGTVTLTDDWWTGTTCERVSLVGFSSPPLVLATLHHTIEGLKHDAASVWVEDVTTASFSLCARELQNFDGAHQDISIDYLAFASVPKNVFPDFGFVMFEENLKPSSRDNYAFCKNVNFTRTYPFSPAVIVTANHKTTVSGNVPAIYNDIMSWVEEISNSGFRVCMKEIKNNGYDALFIDYAVLPVTCDDGWLPHDGYCYKASDQCKSWQEANSTCEASGSSLASVHNKLETYVVGVLSSRKPWIGLRRDNGSLAWSDGSDIDYTHWAIDQLNGKQSCVYESDLKHLFQWSDAECNECRFYVCKQDLDECDAGIDTCHENAICSNNDGSFSCLCQPGYIGDGHSCTLNKCLFGNHDCHKNADCTATVDGFTCQCKSGFYGNGKLCRSCPNGYTYITKTQRCYKVFNSRRNWPDARRQCQNDGGDLVSFKNQEEYELFQNLNTLTGPYWIGFNDISQEGKWEWSDNTPVTFTKWDQGEPNNRDDEDCTHTHDGNPGSSWNDRECGGLFNYACKV